MARASKKATDENAEEGSGRGSRSIWTGSISFGLVTIPVELHAAISEKEVHFHMLHDKDLARVHQKLVCEKDGAEVSREHVVKGYELSRGKYVEIDSEELKKFAPESTQRIDISDFVELSEIDPIYYDHTYAVQPGKGGAKAYSLLREAMMKSERVGIARVVIRTRQSLCALRPTGRGMVLSTMHYADEIISAKSVVESKSNEKELAMAEQLIDALSGTFEPGKYKDDYREEVLGLIKKKAKGKLSQSEASPDDGEPSEVIDLAEALQRSLARRGRGENSKDTKASNAPKKKSAAHSRRSA